MKKSDVETYYDHGTRYPAVNVKHHLWFPDLFNAFEGKGNHEYSDDAGFWAWMHELYDDDSFGSVDAADEWARATCWEQLQTEAEDIWPYRSVIVYGLGRQGGHACVVNLPPVEDWDAIDVAKWAKFKRCAEQIAHEEYPYQFVWNLAVNVWAHIRADRENTYPAPAYAWQANGAEFTDEQYPIVWKDHP